VTIKRKKKLVAAGAEPTSFYTLCELLVLLDRRISADELRLIPKAKQRFEGKITRLNNEMRNKSANEIKFGLILRAEVAADSGPFLRAA
jgi:hypothetical protein